MSNECNIQKVQSKILEVMKFIDDLCRKNNIVYCIMGGTALGAVRHGGFIPWDDDLDIFMTPENYEKFVSAFECEKRDKFILQEWRTTPKYLEYAKVRMNGTTFIEKCFMDKKDMHHGIYVDIMILHKAPRTNFMKRVLYVASKYVTLYALSQRNWKPKTKAQGYVLKLLKFLPNRLLARLCYGLIYSYDKRKKFSEYCYWITPAKFRKGIFAREIFEDIKEIRFEDSLLYAPADVEKYLKIRYGDFMKLPSEEERKAAIHAEIYDTETDYKDYFDRGVI